MRNQDKRRSAESKKTRQDVVYTQAKAFNRKRFILQLVTVVAVVLALLFGMSLFFKADEDKILISGEVVNENKILISGEGKYSFDQIKEASGIRGGENLLTLNEGRISANILKKLPYVKEVQVRKKLPDTVVIHITELEVTYAAADQNGGWWLLSAEGRVVETCPAAEAEDHTRILGVTLQNPVVGEKAAAYETPVTPDENGATVPTTVFASEKLSMALQVIQHLEANGFIGTITKVDVSDLGDVQMWYGSRFQILLGDGSDLPRKIGAISQTLKQMDDHTTGILDATFTIWTDGIGHSDFPKE